jgi:glycosyltransferase involved in cell wall biosynthesis
MPLFSILLPSLRPDYAENAIRQVLMCSVGQDYELIVISPFEVGGDRIRHVPEVEPQGDSAAFHAGLQVASGKIVVPMIDDFAPAYGWLDRIEEAVDVHERRALPFCGSLYWVNHPWFNTAYDLYHPFFPVMSRRSIDRIGEYIDRRFRTHFGDVDLGLRIWSDGGRCALLTEAPIYKARPELDDRQSPLKKLTVQSDFDALVARWHDRYGRGRGRGFNDIVAVRDIGELTDPRWFTPPP